MSEAHSSAALQKMTSGDWDNHRELISRWYISENKTVLGIIKELQKPEHGFTVAPSKLKDRITTWGLRKKLSRQEQRVIASIKRKHREAENSKQEYPFAGQDLSEERIKRLEYRLDNPLMAYVKEKQQDHENQNAVDSTKVDEDEATSDRRTSLCGMMEAEGNMELPVQSLTSFIESGKTKRSQECWASATPIKRLFPCTEKKDVKNVRKVLAITINNHAEKACPDSGSSENIMREDWACDHGIKIRRTRSDRRKLFELGNGKFVRAVGRVRANVAITRVAPGLSSSPRKRKEWFYVFEKCPVPIVLGLPFLEREAIFTTNRHLLEACTKAYDDLDSVLWIGSLRAQSKCSIDGRQAIATADTGSDLNLMSLQYAKNNGHWIDDRPEVKRRLQFGDGSVSETIGQVYINNFSLDWRSPPTVTDLGEDDLVFDEKPQYENLNDTDTVFVQHHVVFHVLPNLPCDIILGQPLLEATDAFSQNGVMFSPIANKHGLKKSLACFDIIIDKGRIWNYFKKKAPAHSAMNQTKSSHDDERHAQWFQRSELDHKLESLTGTARQKKLAELTRLKNQIEAQHKGCAFCT